MALSKNQRDNICVKSESQPIILFHHEVMLINMMIYKGICVCMYLYHL